MRTKYFNQYREDGVVNIVFVESANNDVASFTKNFGQGLRNKNSNKLISKKNQAFWGTSSILGAFGWTPHISE